MNKSDTIGKLSPALVKAQAEMAGAKKSVKNDFFKSKYANLEEVIAVAKDALSNHGLCFLQFPISGEGTAGVETIILHESGEYISNQFLLKCDKQTAQGMGSAITYARRYGLQSACGIPSEDDDGNAASAKKPLMTAKDAASKLETAKTVDDLVKVWNSLPIDLKQVDTVISAKDSQKAKVK